MEKHGPVKPAEVLFPGRVTQVIDPHYFWMLMGSGIYEPRREKTGLRGFRHKPTCTVTEDD